MKQIVQLQEMKQYLRLEPDYLEEDSSILDLILTAEEYVRGATGFTFSESVPHKAKLIVKLLVSHWYENRGIQTTAPNVNKIGFTVETLLGQLAYSHYEEPIVIEVVPYD